MASQKYLIVTADDFGQSAGLTRGIIEGHEHGIVTSASLMVRWPSARGAAIYARAHPRFAVGLHLDFGEQRFHNGEWIWLYRHLSSFAVADIRRETLHQLQLFREIVGREPTHLDSHQHSHLKEPLKSIAIELAGELNIPLRHFTPTVRYCGSFYGQSNEGQPEHERIQVEYLIQIIRSLPPGITELGCHPGYIEDADTMYQEERLVELHTLCDPKVRLSLAECDVQIGSFCELAGLFW
jgi:predicted glycoside hydrolase/deacetylase ChbG (UPF0249 family)